MFKSTYKSEKKDRFPDNALDHLNSPTHVKKKKSPFYISSV